MVINDQKVQVAARASDLSGSSFDDVNLSGAAFVNVNMSGMRISNANLCGMSIKDARLDGATIEGLAITELLAFWEAAHD